MVDESRLIRSVILLGVMVFFVCVIESRAQITEAPKPNGCPVVSVTGPAGVVYPNSLIRFEVTTTPSLHSNLTFYWSTNIGKIRYGQGTKSVEVPYLWEMVGQTLEATVEVKGLPVECEKLASDSMPLEVVLTYVLLSEFSVPISSINTEGLKASAFELNKHPNDQMYMIEYFPVGTSETSIKRKKEKIMSFMTGTLKFDGSRVKIVVAESDDNQPHTKIFRVPPGAPDPSP